jgi:hypothetical protein
MSPYDPDVDEIWRKEREQQAEDDREAAQR